MGVSTYPVLHLLNESSPSEEEVAPLIKRRRIEFGSETAGTEGLTWGDPDQATAAPEGGVSLDAETLPLSEDVETVDLPDAIGEREE